MFEGEDGRRHPLGCIRAILGVGRRGYAAVMYGLIGARRKPREAVRRRRAVAHGHHVHGHDRHIPRLDVLLRRRSGIRENHRQEKNTLESKIGLT